MKLVNELLKIYSKMKKRLKKISTHDYWENRYKKGGKSGAGSYGDKGQYKAKIINEFIVDNAIKSVIEFGCGDGNQLEYSNYSSYLGLDISEEAIKICKEKFKNDKSKEFRLLSEYEGETAELSISLEVIFHLLEEPLFNDHMNLLFGSSEEFVLIFSSNSSDNSKSTALHIHHWKFTDWVTNNRKDWSLIAHIPNNYPLENDSIIFSQSDFYIYQKQMS
jgi:SAM-dependent methyltransferase